MEFQSFFEAKKQELEKEHLWRQLTPASGIDFCSNDYLSFAQNHALKQQILQSCQELPGLGSTGSRLLRGHSLFLDELETTLGELCGKQAALYFSSGYQANLALYSTLLKEQAVVFSDERVHASIIDGIRLARCEKYVWAHNDLDVLEMTLRQKARADRLNFVVVESLYSMLGDRAPLKELAELCQKYGAELIVDEAHATGLFGDKGSGLVEHMSLSDQVFATVHTAGKALGVSGAWVAGSDSLKQWLINKARPFIFTTAPALYQQIALLEAISFYQKAASHLQKSFSQQIQSFQGGLKTVFDNSDIKLSGLGGPITSILVGDNKTCLDLMIALQAEGLDVRAVRPPTVPKGEALLRLTCPLARTSEEISRLHRVLQQKVGSVS